jgi:hypothetical protein
MYAEVRFSDHRDSPPLLVPGDALISANTGPQIAVLLDTGTSTTKKIHLQPVRIGRDYGAETEIAGGLEGTETVVVNPGDDVREGALVRVESLPANGRGTARQ